MATRKTSTSTSAANTNDSTWLELTTEEKDAILSDAAGLLGTIIRLRTKVAEYGLTDQHGEALSKAFTATIDVLKKMDSASAANDSATLMILDRRLDQHTAKPIRLARKAVRENKTD
jgi:hypothetical protein